MAGVRCVVMERNRGRHALFDQWQRTEYIHVHVLRSYRTEDVFVLGVDVYSMHTATNYSTYIACSCGVYGVRHVHVRDGMWLVGAP